MSRRGAATEALLALLAVALLGGCNEAASTAAVRSRPNAAPSASLMPTPSSTPAYDHPDDLAIGQCFDRIIDMGDESLLAGALKSCDEPHEAELIGKYEFPDPADAPYPGDSVVSAAAEEACLSLFADYVGIDFDDSDLAATYYYPTEVLWLSRDRLVNCVVFASSANLFTRSVKGLKE